jgi:hypothetical protein
MRAVKRTDGAAGAKPDREGVIDDAEHVAAQRECDAAEHLPFGH